jgi:hypothetical protein
VGTVVGMRRALLTVLFVAACGDNQAPSADAGLAPASCAGGLATASLTGIYHLQRTLDGATSIVSIRIDPDRGTGSTVLLGDEVVPIERAPGGLVARQGTATEGRTLTIDQLAPDCAIRGSYTRCTSGQCYPFTFIGKRVDRLVEAPAHGLALVGEFVGNPGDVWTQAGLPVNVRVADKIAYVATYGDGLRIVDVHDPAHPVELGHVAPELGGEWYNDVKLVDGPAGRYALMASTSSAVVVIDVHDPWRPEITQQLAHGEVHTLFVDGHTAYLAAIDHLEIWDVTNPKIPVKRGQWADPTAPVGAYLHDLYVAGDRAYLNYWNGGMIVLDVADPAAPVVVGRYRRDGQETSHSNWVTQVGARTLSIHGDEQWDAHVHVVDVTEGTPAFTTSIGEWRTRPEVSVHNIMAQGDRAYVAYYQDGVRVLDLSDPTAPRQIAWFNTWPGYDPRYGASVWEGAIGIDVDLADRLIYVADSHRGLLILRLEI